ncbi:ABC transporter substrate-binding protein [Arcobacter sp. KX21116]|uniref:ABC transporter substrate-binding protein n=1 Tax=Arcobacter iocasae TaxID=2906515 RepID=UPI0035D40396
MKKLLIILILVITFLHSNELKKVKLQFMWLDQFEFAGFYVAKEKGFYQDLGIDVQFIKYEPNINIVDKVLDKEIDFGMTSSSLIIDKANGKDVVLIGTIFQSSPLILLALKKSKINTIKDIKNKTLMVTNDQKLFATLQSMLTTNNMSINDLNILEHSFNVDDLINKKTDLMLAYITNEPFILKQKGYESKIFYPKDYGFDFYEELIFTSKELVKKDPKLVENFFSATIKGWEYAFNNIDEVSKLIYKNYNPQNKTLDSLIYEANEMKKLVFDKEGKIGAVKEDKINLIINTYKLMGYIKNEINLDEFIFKNNMNSFLTHEEKTYLKNKKFITMCTEPDWLPYEKIENGKHIGIVSEYIQAIEKMIDTKIKLIPTDNWTQTLQYAKKRKCDIVSSAINTEKRRAYLTFTNPFINSSLAIVSTIDKPFIDNIMQVKKEKIALIKDYAYSNMMRKKYPLIDFVEVKNIKEGIERVKDGEVFGLIDTVHTLAYTIQKDYIGQLKITGRLDEQSNLSIGVRKDEPILRDILNKALDKIPESEINRMQNKWISINYQKGLDYDFIVKSLFIMFVILFILVLIYRQFLLKKLNDKLNKKVKEEIEKNEEKNKILLKQSKMASMGEMLENIAHQWRQPLSNISVSASGLQLKKEELTITDEELDDTLEHILKSARYLSNTIDDFRSFFKMDKKLELAHIEDIVDKALFLASSKYAKDNFSIIKNIDNIEFKTSENDLIQVFLNIITNAKDALNENVKDEDKYIFIDAFKEKDNLIIEIKDNAGGVREEIINKIFDAYFTTKKEFHGTGIGLNMSKLLVELHLKGSIEAINCTYNYENKTYKGVIFKLVLPIDLD